MSNPLGGSVIRGTGGLRKLRFAAEQDYRGKRGADRICYAYYPDHHIVLMVAAFPKNRKANISEDEKKGIKKYLDQVRNWLDTNEDGGP